MLMFIHISQEFEAPVISSNIRTAGLCVKTVIILQRKYMYVPNYAYIESMLINFIQMSLCNTFPMQAFYNNSKHRRRGCIKETRLPQRMQRIWSRTLATPYVRGLKINIFILILLTLQYPSSMGLHQNPCLLKLMVGSFEFHLITQYV